MNGQSDRRRNVRLGVLLGVGFGGTCLAACSIPRRGHDPGAPHVLRTDVRGLVCRGVCRISAHGTTRRRHQGCCIRGVRDIRGLRRHGDFAGQRLPRIPDGQTGLAEPDGSISRERIAELEELHQLPLRDWGALQDPRRDDHRRLHWSNRRTARQRVHPYTSWNLTTKARRHEGTKARRQIQREGAD
jgi:hypothetical protein